MVAESRMTREDARAVLQRYEHNVEPLSDQYISASMGTMLNSRPRRSDRAAHRRWLRGHRLVSMSRNDAEMKRARLILDTPTLRTTAEILVASGASDEEIAEAMSTLRGGVFTYREIALFRHYFWNLSSMSPALRHAYLQTYSTPAHRHAVLNVYMRGIDQAVWKAGGTGKRSLDQISDMLIQTAAARFSELDNFPNGIQTATAAAAWAGVIEKAAVRKSVTSDDVTKVLSELHAFSLKQGRREITSIESLQDEEG